MTTTEKLIGLPFQKLKSILDSGKFDKLIGQAEGDCFEAKQKIPYEIGSPDEKVRLPALVKMAGDVAGMANDRGGFIVCGLTTIPLYSSLNDQVKGLNPFPENEFYTKKLVRSSVNSCIYPKLEVEVSWYPSKANPALGLGIIYVPPQEKSRKYFLVKISENLNSNYFGIPIRRGSNTNWKAPYEIYKLTKREPSDIKQTHDSLTSQITELANQITELREIVLKSKTPLPPPPADSLKRKIEEVLNAK